MFPTGDDQPWIIGILNVTPDSFSDGGQFIDPQAALAHAARLLDEGASVIDIGGESTRPGARRIDADEQIARTRPVVQAVARVIRDRQSSARISIDTTRSTVAAAAIEAGATMVNDVSAGREDPDMLPLAAAHGVGLILMHMLGEPATMQQNPTYHDVVMEVMAFLQERAATAETAGIPPGRIAIDPGIGFGKTVEHNLMLLANLDRLVRTGYPVVLGTSRKRFLRVICGRETDATRPADLVAATCATTTIGMLAGVRSFRVHDVAANRDAAWVAHATTRYAAPD